MNQISTDNPSFSGTPFHLLALKLPRVLVVLVMLIAVLAVYWPPSAEPDSLQIGLDYIQLHSRRMQFARDAIFAPAPALPAWYPRELLGTPFWSNIQNFPFIPTRLLVLLAMEPNGPYTYAVAVSLSALLAALFTFLYLRKIGLGLIGSAAAGWTFACSGYFASRVTAGHLSLLEGYPALPLLLWVIESQLQADEQNKSLRLWLMAVATSGCCVLLAGHPQLPVYSISVGLLYALWRGRLKQALRVWGALALGIGLAAFALVPMAMLILRSTRMLNLVTPVNDLAMPYGRLAAFFFPWRDGAPPPLGLAAVHPFQGYPSPAYFWDSVSYTGLMPWMAVLLLCRFVARVTFNRNEFRIAVFVTALCVSGIVLSLPFVDQVRSLIPGTFLRSPVRLVYLTVFALSLASGVALHLAMTFWASTLARFMLALLLVVHIVDLGSHDRHFIMRGSFLPLSEILADALKSVGDGRVAIDYNLALKDNRTVDDVGFFDSIMLAAPYQWVLSLAEAPQDLNIQDLNGSAIPLRALEAAGVKLMVTASERKDLWGKESIRGIRIYRVPQPLPRAAFFAADQIRYLTADQIRARLRDSEFDLRSVLLLENATHDPSSSKTVQTHGHPIVKYRRPDSDHIEVTVTTGQSGVLRIIESWDPGWSATVNGSPVPIVRALGALLSVPVSAGHHNVRFVYRTPGAATGQAISMISLLLLCVLLRGSCSRRQNS